MTYKTYYTTRRETQHRPAFSGHRLSVLILSFFVALLPIMAILQLPATLSVSADPLSKLAPTLQTTLQQAGPDEEVRVIIYFEQEDNLSQLPLSNQVLIRREQVVGHLQQTAVSAQSNLLPQLQSFRQSGDISTFRPFWIINAIAVTGTPAAIEQLAAQPEVMRVVLDEQHQYFDPPEKTFDPDALLSTTAVFTSPVRSWGIDRIKAPYVWHGLGIDGTGVTVAIMDSGVDWQHPDLLPNYRGNLGGGSFSHAGNWFYAPDPSITVPTDTLGHGTHVAGTAVGQNGIGVAPGAQWIAVGLTDESGLIFDSDVHAGFEWLLAPNGNPALAPDVINNSWGALSTRTVFYDDIEALQSAGIVTVFSAGNSGPFPETIGVPAAYTNTIAVGASDDLDLIAWFSSRGPSPLTTEQHPHLVAPGTTILSSYPGNRYAYFNGTSMASPHVVGTIALLLSADPSLTRTELLNRLQETAVPIDPPHPNNDTGWGLPDAYAAAGSYVATGELQGIVRFNSIPQAGVVVTVTNGSGHSIPFVTDANGRYEATLRPGTYVVTTAPFGFERITIAGISITANQTTTRNINLIRQPQGIIQGIVQNADTGALLAGVTIAAKGTPVTAVTDSNGRYTLSLPMGQVKLVATKTGYKLDRATVLPQAGQTQTIDFDLTPTDYILVIDSGQWVYASEIDYYHNALSALNYSFDTWSIRNPFTDIPPSLSNYDIVIWSDPYYAPGYIGAGALITDFLKHGGNLLISGQNVAAFDGSIFSPARWWYAYLGADFMGKTAVNQAVSGAAGSAFSEITLALNGGTSANNQFAVDTSRPRPGSVTEPVLYYDDGTIAGLQSGRCQPYDIVYFGFGLEGVSGGVDRTGLIQYAFDTFAAPQTVAGLRWESKLVDRFALQGDHLVYTLTLRNLSERYTDTFAINPTYFDWPVTVISPTVTLGPCETGKTAVSIQVPNNAPIDTENLTELTAVSTINSAVTSAFILRHKTPGRILLVDDDRWYDQEALFQPLLNESGLNLDVWSTLDLPDVAGPNTLAEFLQAYEMIIWYTAYDWFAPVTPAEREALQLYLDNGGRLFLTSQDFLFYHHRTPIVPDYLGVFDYQEGITPTIVYGSDFPGLQSELAGPLPLDYDPYQNFSDGIIPNPESKVLFWSDAGLPAAIARSTDQYRVAFMSIPFETITDTAQSAAMNQLVGWIGDLGDSTVVVDKLGGTTNDVRTFTITVRNDSQGVANDVTVTNRLPASLLIESGSIQGGATYQAATRTLSWTGSLADGGVHQIQYRAAIAPGLPAGTMIENPVTFHYARHNLAYDQFATIWVEAPDLHDSTVTGTPNAPFAATAVSYTLQLRNTGLAATDGITAVFRIPEPLYVVSSSLTAATGTATLDKRTVTWSGDIGAGAGTTITLLLTRTTGISTIWYPTALILEEGTTGTHLIENRLLLQPYQQYFPFIARE